MNLEIEELEKKFRTIMEGNPIRPALASLAVQGQSDIELAEEFATAVKTLSSRAHKKRSRETSITHPPTSLWL